MNLADKSVSARIVGFFTVLALSLAVYSVRPAGAAQEVLDIPVPTMVIYAGQKITASMLGPRTVPVRYANSHPVFLTYDNLVGMVARTTLMPRQPIALNQVVEPDVVSVNRPTLMLFSTGRLLITGEVLPLNAAKAGEMVRARNIHSGLVVRGIAQPDGTITAGLGSMSTAGVR